MIKPHVYFRYGHYWVSRYSCEAFRSGFASEMRDGYETLRAAHEAAAELWPARKVAPLEPQLRLGICDVVAQKWSYPTRAAAKAAMKQVRAAVRADGAGSKVPCRTYECPWCRMWHLTSKPAVGADPAGSLTGA